MRAVDLHAHSTASDGSCCPHSKEDSDGKMEVFAGGVYPCVVPFVDSDTREGFVAVRAHHLFLQEGSPLTATVQRKLYQGNQTEYQLDFGDGVLIRMMTDVTYEKDVGESVSVGIEKVVWLDE